MAFLFSPFLPLLLLLPVVSTSSATDISIFHSKAPPPPAATSLFDSVLAAAHTDPARLAFLSNKATSVSIASGQQLLQVSSSSSSTPAPTPPGSPAPLAPPAPPPPLSSFPPIPSPTPPSLAPPLGAPFSKANPVLPPPPAPPHPHARITPATAATPPSLPPSLKTLSVYLPTSSPNTPLAALTPLPAVQPTYLSKGSWDWAVEPCRCSPRPVPCTRGSSPTAFQALNPTISPARPGRTAPEHPNHPAAPKPAPPVLVLRESDRHQRGPGPGSGPARLVRVRPGHWGRHCGRLGDRHHSVRLADLRGAEGRVQAASQRVGRVLGAGGVRHVLQHGRGGEDAAGDVPIGGAGSGAPRGEHFDPQQRAAAGVPRHGGGAGERELGGERDRQPSAAEHEGGDRRGEREGGVRTRGVQLREDGIR